MTFIDELNVALYILFYSMTLLCMTINLKPSSNHDTENLVSLNIHLIGIHQEFKYHSIFAQKKNMVNLKQIGIVQINSR